MLSLILQGEIVGRSQLGELWPVPLHVVCIQFFIEAGNDYSCDDRYETMSYIFLTFNISITTVRHADGDTRVPLRFVAFARE